MTSTLAQFSSGLADTVAALTQPDFPQRLAHLLSSLAGADDATLLHFRDGRLPEVAYNKPPEAGRVTTLDTYLKGAFLLDPYYRAAAMNNRYGVFQLRDLAPAGFKESEYYKSWYGRSGFNDECGLLIKLDDGFLHLSLALLDSGSRFAKRQVTTLQAVFPAIEALARAYWQELPATAPSSTASTSTPNLRQQLHDSLSAFGSSVLTRRERQVTELVLLGNSTRIIAEKLGISTETVKLHRKHAYAKLDVSSQAELFLLFMEALAYSPDSGETDPLIAYHSKPARR